MIARSFWTKWWGLLVALALAGCAQQERAAQPAVEEKKYTLTPVTASLKISFLTGELKDLRVVERVEQGSGRIIDPPKLLATLTLKNSSSDQTARPVSGRIEYADAEGNPIPLVEGRGDTSFKFSSYQAERLDPGMETSRTIEVPFPAAGLKERGLRDIRLELSFIPTPYREESTSIPVSLAK